MDEAQLKVLLDAAKMAGIPASELKPCNPWSKTGPRAQAMQMAVQSVAPVMAAQFRLDAGQTLSLEAAAVQAGLQEMSKSVYEELNELSPDHITGQQEAAARRESDLLDQMGKAADDLAAKREKQQQAFARSAGKNNAGGQYTRDFYRRMGVQNAAQLGNLPARRALGQ